MNVGSPRRKRWQPEVDLEHGHLYTAIVPLDYVFRLYLSKARFKRRATVMPNSIDRIKFDFSTAVARHLKPSRATAVPNSIHKLQIH